MRDATDLRCEHTLDASEHMHASDANFADGGVPHRRISLAVGESTELQCDRGWAVSGESCAEA